MFVDSFLTSIVTTKLEPLGITLLVIEIDIRTPRTGLPQLVIPDSELVDCAIQAVAPHTTTIRKYNRAFTPFGRCVTYLFYFYFQIRLQPHIPPILQLEIPGCFKHIISRRHIFLRRRKAGRFKILVHAGKDPPRAALSRLQV